MLRAGLRHTAIVSAFALLPLLHAAAFSILPDIVTSTTVPANGDLNPYGVAVVPAGFPIGAAIKPGDVLARTSTTERICRAPARQSLS
jgi:hypothetical protein